jgi:hypothetical protein
MPPHGKTFLLLLICALDLRVEIHAYDLKGTGDLKPMGCRRCSGNGSRKRLGRSRSACGRCQGTGRHFRPGARLVHAGAVLAVDTICEQVERRREAGQ